MRAVMLSVRPQWCEKICHQIGTENGKPVYEKPLEVRKTAPKIPTPFKCYIYETRGKKAWTDIPIPEDQGGGEIRDLVRTGGKVIGEFVCDKMYGIYYSMYPHDPPVFEEIGTLNRPDLQEKTCLSEIEIDDYLNWNNGYGWHISDLKIYDKPKELNEFQKPIMPTGLRYEDDTIKRPPQSWCYVEELI